MKDEAGVARGFGEMIRRASGPESTKTIVDISGWRSWHCQNRRKKTDTANGRREKFQKYCDFWFVRLRLTGCTTEKHIELRRHLSL